MAAVTSRSDFGAQENSLSLFPFSPPTICHELMGLDAMILSFRMLSFQPDFSLSFFIFIQNFFSSSSLSAIRVVWSVYQRLLIFLLANLIPACDSSSLAFLMIYSAYKLNKQSDNIQPWCTPFPILNQPTIPCLVPPPGIKPLALHWKHGVLTTGLPGKSWFHHYLLNIVHVPGTFQTLEIE